MFLDKLAANFAQASRVESEALIALAVTTYLIDGKIAEAEQAHFDELVESLPWGEGTSKDSVVANLRNEVGRAIDAGGVDSVLDKYCPALAGNGDVLAVIDELIVADGRIADKESSLLDAIKQRILGD